MRDLGYLAMFLAFASALSFGLAWLLAKKAKHLSRARILLLASAPIPAILIALSIYLVIRAYTATAEECDVDACGFMIAGAVIFMCTAALAAVLGWAVATIAHRVAQRCQ